MFWIRAPEFDFTRTILRKGCATALSDTGRYHQVPYARELLGSQCAILVYWHECHNQTSSWEKGAIVRIGTILLWITEQLMHRFRTHDGKHWYQRSTNVPGSVQQSRFVLLPVDKVQYAENTTQTAGWTEEGLHSKWQKQKAGQPLASEVPLMVYRHGHMYVCYQNYLVPNSRFPQMISFSPPITNSNFIGKLVHEFNLT